MAEVRDLLNQVWSHFRSAGIADDLTIIEHVAALLTEDLALFRENLRERKPSRDSVNLEKVKTLLSQAASEAGGKAVLFNHHVLFRLPAMQPGGRYPTPRHIVQMMHRLAGVRSDHVLADLACGSGGFLVHEASGAAENLLGCEISPEWARLAWANCALHGATRARIEVGSALGLCTDGGPLAADLFDRILMNPPFGEKVDPKKVKAALGGPAGGRSETALLTLALNKLADGGRACVLVPSGLLFSMSSAEQGLRKRLVDDHQLEAVVGLPKDGFQPYSSLQTHLIMARKAPPKKDTPTWFLHAQHDGYPAGRSRDLTQPPEAESDFPLLEAIIGGDSKNWDDVFPTGESPFIGVKKLVDGGGQSLGVTVCALNGAFLARAERFSTPESPLVLVSAATQGNEELVWVCIETAAGKAGMVQNRDEWLREKLGISKKRELAPDFVFLREGEDARSLAVATDGRLMGVRTPQSRIRHMGYDLRPERYIRSEEEKREAVPTAKLLAEIRRNQRRLIGKVDGLLGRMDMPPVAGERIPPRIWEENDAPLQPFGELSEEQKAIWERICSKVELHTNGETKYRTPVPFTASEIETLEGSKPSPAVQSTLDLLERMGLVVSITVTSPENEEALPCYRLAAERDQWKDDRDEAGKGEEVL